MSKPQQYKKKPVVIDACQFNPPSGKNWSEEHTAEFEDLVKFTNHLVRWETYHDGARLLYVFDRLHDTWVQFYAGDYILKGIDGEFYPCNKDIFERTYDKVGVRGEHQVIKA